MPTVFVALIKKIIQLLNYLIGLVLWLFGLGLMVWYPMRWWPGDRFTPVQMLNYFMPWLLVPLIPGLIMAAVSRRRRLTLLMAMPTTLIMYSYAPLFLPRALPPTLADNGRLKVMSYNIWHLNRHISDVTNLIQQEQPDLLLLQELYGGRATRLTQELSNLYPEQDTPYYIIDSSYGQSIVSRYPLTDLGTTYKQGRAQKAIMHTPQGDILVWNIHTQAPRSWWVQIHHWQLVKLGQNLANIDQDQPIIIGGDFNTTDQSEAYRMLNQYVDNAHWEVGWGFGFTYPANGLLVKGVRVPTNPPLVRIDHIFHSDHFFSHQAKTLSDSGGSDHFPVIAELSLIQ